MHWLNADAVSSQCTLFEYKPWNSYFAGFAALCGIMHIGKIQAGRMDVEMDCLFSSLLHFLCLYDCTSGWKHHSYIAVLNDVFPSLGDVLWFCGYKEAAEDHRILCVYQCISGFAADDRLLWFRYPHSVYSSSNYT